MAIDSPDRAGKKAWAFWLRLSLTSAGLILGAAAIWIGLRYLRPQAAMPRSAIVPPPLASSAENDTSAAGEAGTTTTLLLAPAVRQGQTGAALDLRPSIRTIRVQWVVSPEIRARVFEMTVTRRGKLLARVRQHDALREIGGSRVAEFRLMAEIFAGTSSRPDYLLSIRAADHPDEIVSQYPVVVSRESGR